MPNLIDLRQATNAGQAAAKQGLGFGRSGNPTLRGTLRRFSRQVKHRVQDHTGVGGARAAERYRDKARGVNSIVDEQAREVRKLSPYHRQVKSTADRLRRTQGGEEAVRTLRNSPGNRTLPYNTPENKAETDYLLRTSQSGQEAADDFLRTEQKRYVNSANKAYARDQQGHRLKRHAQTYKNRVHQANKRTTQTDRAINAVIPATTATAAVGNGIYNDVQNRRSDGENNLSQAQKNVLKQAPKLSRYAGSPKERRELYNEAYGDAMSLPSQYQTLNAASTVGGGVGGAYLGKSVKGLVGGAALGSLGANAINTYLSSGAREEALNRTKDESNKDFRNRVKRLAAQKKES